MFRDYLVSRDRAVHKPYFYFAIKCFFISFLASSFPRRRLPGSFNVSVVRAVCQRSTFNGLFRIFPITAFKRRVEGYRRSSRRGPVFTSKPVSDVCRRNSTFKTSIYSRAFQSTVLAGIRKTVCTNSVCT